MLKGQPNFRPASTTPFSMLLDFYVNGNKLSNVTYDETFAWILDQTGYPAEVGTDATSIAATPRPSDEQARGALDRLGPPLTVRMRADKNLTVEVRSFYGDEASGPAAIQHAQWRYLEAFWYGDVFLYNGHSHFGNGPLEPSLYGPQNFNDRYQLMVVNSCLSYNYYHQDFFKMKPGGTKNLEILVNGSPSYVWGGGEATADFLLALLDASPQSYVSVLTAMRINLPWGVSSTTRCAWSTASSTTSTRQSRPRSPSPWAPRSTDRCGYISSKVFACSSTQSRRSARPTRSAHVLTVASSKPPFARRASTSSTAASAPVGPGRRRCVTSRCSGRMTWMFPRSATWRASERIAALKATFLKAMRSTTAPSYKA